MAIPFALGKVIDIIYSVDQEAMVQNLTNISLGLVGVFLIGAACNFGRTYLMGVSGIDCNVFFSRSFLVFKRNVPISRAENYPKSTQQRILGHSQAGNSFFR